MNSRRIEQQMRRLAEQQHGVVARRQLTELGMSRATARHLITRGYLERMSTRVLRLVGSASTAEQRLMFAVLHAPQPAAVSHRSAVDRWGVPGFGGETMHVTAPGRLGSRIEALELIVHRPRLFLPHHVVRLDGIPITTPTRTLFDLAGKRGIRPQRLARALDTSLSRRLTSIHALHRMLVELSASGRSGICLMRQLVEERDSPNYRAPESGLESRFRELCKRAGMPELVGQVDVGTNEAWVGRVDFRHPDLPILVEIDSATYHGSLTDQRSDEARREKLQAAGWVVMSITGSELFHRADKVVARLRRAIHETSPVG